MGYLQAHLDDSHNHGGQGRTQHRRNRVRQVQNPQVLSGLVRVGQDRDVQGLVDGVVGAVAETRDRGEEVHPQLGRHNQRHHRAQRKEAAGQGDGQFAPANPVRHWPGEHGREQRNNQRDESHAANQRGRRRLWVDLGGIDIVLGDVEQIGVDHPVAAHHQGATHQRIVEIRRTLGWAESQQQHLHREFLARLVAVVAFARPDRDGDDADQREYSQRQHPPQEQPAFHVQEGGTHQVTKRLTCGDARSVEARDGAAVLVGDAVGHGGDERRQHDVVTQLGHAPHHQDGREGIEQRNGAHRQARHQSARDDPRGASPEARTGQVRQRPENHVGDQGDHGAGRVGQTQHGFFVDGVDVFQHRRQNYRGQRHPRNRAEHAVKG